MNRDHRKISRTYEERNILASSISRVSQISQTDNELKQKLLAIDTSHKLSNKRIKNETRELKEILHGLQRELKVSKGINHSQYVPSQFEQPPRRSRRTTVSSVPSEDRKEVGFERDLQRSEKRNSDDLARNRSGSFPPVSEARDEKKINDALDDKFAENKLDTQHDVFDEPGGEVIKVFIEQTKSAQQTNDWQNDEITLTPRAQNKTELPSIEQENYPQRRISGTGIDPKRLAKSSPKEQQQQGERKRSTSDVFRGRFVTADTNYLDTSLSSSTRRTSQTQPRGEVGRGVNRLRPSIVEEFSSVPNQKEQRKTSLGMPPYPWQRKGSVGNRGDSPMTGHGSLGRLDSHDAEVVFDALPDYLGGRRLSVAQGRVRRISRGTGLPPLKEERVAQKKSLQGSSAENWSDLSKCRYLRKEEQEISIDDIFDKK